MADWILNTSDTWLRSIYDVLHKSLCKESVLHADEVTLQVLKESNRAATSKSYMWLYRTSGYTKTNLGKALHYLLEPWPYLIRYLEDGRLELSNNRAEHSIKPCVWGRKN